MLLAAELTNFKKHNSLSVNFTDGMNVIRGPNFSGKSTLLAAIAFALYGMRAIGSDKSELITTGEKSCKVSLNLITPEDGTEVEVIRTHKDAKVLNVKTGEMIATGSTSVTSWVEDTYGADVKEFLTHTYSRQMETSVLLTIGATDLQKKVEAMAKISIIDKMIKKAGKNATFLSGKIEGMDIGEFSIEQLKEMLKESEVAHELHASTLKDAAEVFDNACNKKKELEENIRKAEASNEKVNFAIDCMAGLKIRLMDVEKQFEESKDQVNSFPKDLAEQAQAATKKESEFLKNHLENAKKAPRRDSAEISLYETEEWIGITGKPNVKLAEELDIVIANEQSQLDGLEKIYVTAKESVRSIQLDISRLEKALDEGECPTCHREHENFNQRDLETEIKKLNARTEILLGETDIASKSYTESKENLDQLIEEHPGDGTQEALDSAVAQLSELKKEIEEYKDLPSSDKIEVAEHELATLTTVREDLNLALSDQTLATSELESLKRSINQLLDDIAKQEPIANTSLLEVNEFYTQLRHSQNDLETAKENLADVTREDTELEYDVTAKGNALTVARNKEVEVKQVKVKLNLTQDLQKYLRDSRTRFLGSIWGVILARASEIASSTTQNQEDQITEIRLKDNGTFSYVEKGREFSVKSASGCQQEIMGVALRLALCDLFYGQSSYLMLDEASSQMNEENSAALAGILAATGKQILYVTHRMAEQTIAQNVIFIGGEQ